MQRTSESSEHNPLGHFIDSISSYDSNIMLAAVISLLLVILFVLLLHIYAKWFLAQARQRRRSSSAALTASHALLPSRFHHFHTFDNTTLSGSPPPKGLDASVISAIPLFVYKQQEHTQGLECVICLTAFEENDVGRSLTKCDHSFHVECIDMWLHSHTNCPICRAPAVGENDIANDAKSTDVGRESSTEVHSSDGASSLDAVIDVSTLDNENGNPLMMNTYTLSDSSSPSSSSSLGSSLRRMLSRNRPDRKVFPSSSVTEGTA